MRIGADGSTFTFFEVYTFQSFVDSPIFFVYTVVTVLFGKHNECTFTFVYRRKYLTKIMRLLNSKQNC